MVTLRAVALALVAGPAAALAPLPPCEGVVESGMMVSEVTTLGRFGGDSGVTVESYGNAYHLVGDTYVPRPAPVTALDGVNGTRVLACGTGDFVVVPFVQPTEVNAAISATEFLRGRLAEGQRIAFSDVRQAAEAVYGDVIILRETEETCACANYYPELRAPGATPYGARTDLE